MTINFRPSARERMIAALNTNPRYPITADDVAIGIPSVTTLNGRNTRVTITAASAKFEATRTLYYNRLNLQQLIGTGIVLPLTVVNPTNSHDLLAAVYDQYQIRLTPEDIVLEPVTGGNYSLKAAPASLGWLGTLDVVLGDAPVDYTHYVMCLDDGSVFALDNDYILLDDRDIAD